jgi:hypothetical protein
VPLDASRRFDLVASFGRLRAPHFAGFTAVVTLVVVSAFSRWFHGEVRSDYLVTGFVTAAAMGFPVVGALLGHQRRLEGEIAQREAAEREKAALIEKLEHTLALERELAAMRVREEKLRTLRLTMSKVHHHINNLANNLQLVAMEYEDTGTLSRATLTALDGAVHESTREMKALASIEDPFDEESFRIKV